MGKSGHQIKSCPACGSRRIKYIGDKQQPSIYGLGLLYIHQFIGGIYDGHGQYQCESCHYQFNPPE